MKAAAVLLAVIFTAFPPCGRAQNGPPPQPTPSDKPDKPNREHGRGSRQGFGGPGGSGMMSHGDREHFDIFKDMPAVQKQKVRAAFEKVWKKQEVVEARERLVKANEEYRKSIHDALAEADPEAAKILDNRKPPMGQGMQGKMPDINDPEFASKALHRLRMESPTGEHRESPMSKVHEKIMQSPVVAEAVKNLQQAEPAKRMEAWTHLREAYQVASKAELGKLRENFKKDGLGHSPQDQKEGAASFGEPRE